MDVTSSLRSLLPYGRRSIGINQLIDKLETYLSHEDVERVQAAYDFAFHVVEHWIDPGYRFHGLAHFFSWCWRRVRERCPHSARRPSP